MHVCLHEHMLEGSGEGCGGRLPLESICQVEGGRKGEKEGGERDSRDQETQRDKA